MNLELVAGNTIIRDRMKDLLRPYDFANFLRAAHSKPTEHEKRTYLTPMNELFHTDRLYPILDKENMRIAVIGKNLVKMEVQLNVLSELWNKNIYDHQISVLVIIVCSSPVTDNHIKDVVNSVRTSDTVNINFHCISTERRKIHRDLLCITDADFTFTEELPDTHVTLIGDPHPNREATYDPMTVHTDPGDSALSKLVLEYSNRYSETYETYYVTNVEAELGVASARSGTISIPTDLPWRGSWSSLVLTMDFIDLSEISSEILATGILIPFSFRTF